MGGRKTLKKNQRAWLASGRVLLSERFWVRYLPRVVSVLEQSTLIFLKGDILKEIKWFHLLRKLAHAEIFIALKIENFQLKNFDIFLIFAQNINCGYTLEPPRRGNLCFGAKIRKTCIPLHTPVLLYKWGSRGYTLHGHVLEQK